MNQELLIYWESLFRELNKSCDKLIVWKKIKQIEGAFLGLYDLDLLIKTNNNEYLITVKNYGFFELKSNCFQDKKIRHFFKIDSTTGSVIHLHLYLDLVTGVGHFKNYAIPDSIIEGLSTQKHEQFTFLNHFTPQSQKVIEHYRQCIKNKNLLNIYYRKKKAVLYGDNSPYFDKQKGNSSNKRPIYKTDQTEKISKNSENCKIWRRKEIRITHFIKGYIYLIAAKAELIPKKYYRKPGFFLAIIGPDGVGKSTMVSNVTNCFNKISCSKNASLGRIWSGNNNSKRSKSTVSIRSPIFNHFKNLVVASIRGLKFIVVRIQLKLGYIVITDRVMLDIIGAVDSPRIPLGENTNLTQKIISKIEQKIYGICPKPNLTIILKAPLESVLKRNQKRTKQGKETDEEIKMRYHAFFKYCEHYQNSIVIDSDRNEKVVSNDVISIINKYFVENQ